MRRRDMNFSERIQAQMADHGAHLTGGEGKLASLPQFQPAKGAICLPSLNCATRILCFVAL